MLGLTKVGFQFAQKINRYLCSSIIWGSCLSLRVKFKVVSSTVVQKNGRLCKKRLIACFWTFYHDPLQPLLFVSWNKKLEFTILLALPYSRPWNLNALRSYVQSLETQGFCVSDFATPADEGRSHSKIFQLFIVDRSVRKFQGLTSAKIFGILQTVLISTSNRMVWRAIKD